MNVLFEEDGAFKAGAVLADQTTSLQVELASGKRTKVKAASVLLRFAEPGPAELLERAGAEAEAMDTEFLWEACGDEEFGFEDFAADYFGAKPTPAQAAALLLRLHSAPMWFHRKGRGRFRKAPAEILQAALAGMEKKRLQQETQERLALELEAGRMPVELSALMPAALYKPDRNRLEVKALEAACERSGLTAPQLLRRAGALGSAYAYHLGRFLFEQFPDGTDFAPLEVPEPAADLPLAEVRAFSIDDATTTEIDDAFSVTPLDGGGWRIGIHIAAPGLGFQPDAPLGEVARARLSTVYFPGNKITMLPDALVERFTLAEGAARPAVSMYLEVAPDLRVLGNETRVERVPVVANLRHHDIEPLFNEDTLAAEDPPEFAWREPLTLLWRLATVLEAGRGKPAANQGLTDFSFYVDWNHADGDEPGAVTVVERRRGSPLDKLVAELMIHANAAWGKLLDTAGVPAIYRVQTAGRVRMTTACGPHEGLGVEGYAWCTSPLRRYVDLVNQWQLLAHLRGEAAPFGARSEALLAAVRDFDLAYTAYAEFQRHMERYWCLRWVQQQPAGPLPALVVRESLVRLAGAPLFLRCPSLPALEARSPVSVDVERIDLLEADAACRFVAAVVATDTPNKGGIPA